MLVRTAGAPRRPTGAREAAGGQHSEGFLTWSREGAVHREVAGPRWETGPVSTSAPQSADAPGAGTPPAGPVSAGPPSGAAGSPQGPPVAGRKRGGGTAADMVRSLVIIVGLVAVVVFAVPRPQGRIQQPVDVTTVVAQARAAGIAVDEPEVPEAWTPNIASFGPDQREGLPTLSLGFVETDGTYVGVRVTRGATPDWTRTVTGSGEESADGATVGVGVTPWQRLTSEESAKRTSLLLDQDGTTYVVTGTAPIEDLTDVAAQLVPSDG